MGFLLACPQISIVCTHIQKSQLCAHILSKSHKLETVYPPRYEVLNFGNDNNKTKMPFYILNFSPLLTTFSWDSTSSKFSTSVGVGDWERERITGGLREREREERSGAWHLVEERGIEYDSLRGCFRIFNYGLLWFESKKWIS